jgi:aldose 1-epimerase
LEVFTDQDALQVYSCVQQDGTVPLKKTQGIPGRKRVVEKYGCLVLEVQDWIDGINHPEWGRLDRQVFGPDTNAFQVAAKYRFSNDKK